jgi:hypothetical protein
VSNAEDSRERGKTLMPVILFFVKRFTAEDAGEENSK